MRLGGHFKLSRWTFQNEMGFLRHDETTGCGRLISTLFFCRWIRRNQGGWGLLAVCLVFMDETAACPDVPLCPD